MKLKSALLILLVTTSLLEAQENQAPVFVKEMPDTTPNLNRLYKYIYQATDPDGDVIKYFPATTLPNGASLDSITGEFRWTPTNRHVGKYEIIVNATDGELSTASRKTKISVVSYGSYANQITVSCKPESGGRSSNILCNVGDTISAKAWSNLGYRFMNWTENDSSVYRDSVYTFVVTKYRNLVANFRVNRPPVFVKEMPDTTFISDIFVSTFRAIDPDGDTVKYYATKLFPNMAALVPTSGVFGWRPSQLEAAMNFIQIYATDGQLKTYSRISSVNYNTFGTYFSKTIYLNVKPNNAGYAYRIINNDSINLRAVPYTGYKFLNWTYNGAVVTYDSVYTILKKNITGHIRLEANFSELTSVQNKNQLPSGYHLSQNFPNPFNPETTISYSLPKGEHVTLKIFDVLGREVATLVDEIKQAGSYKQIFNVKIRHGVSLQSGVYFYQLKAGSYVETKKMLLLK